MSKKPVSFYSSFEIPRVRDVMKSPKDDRVAAFRTDRIYLAI